MARSQVPNGATPLPISEDMPKEKTSRRSMVQTNLQVVPEAIASENYSEAMTKQGYDEEGSRSIEERAPSDHNREDKLIPNQRL